MDDGKPVGGVIIKVDGDKGDLDILFTSPKAHSKGIGFAAGCSREVIERGAQQLGWDLDKLLTITLQAMAANEDLINEEFEGYKG